MKLSVPAKSSPPSFIPDNPFAKVILGLFLNDKYADIVFEMRDGKGEEHTRKKFKTVPKTFPAHRNIVASCSSILADMCESQGDGTTTIDISGILPDVFISYFSSCMVVKCQMRI